MRLLTVKHIQDIHDFVVKETGGPFGVRDQGRLEAVIAVQSQHVFGKETYPGPYQKAAAIVQAIIVDHPFLDGNKRTAMLAGLTFLSNNKIEFKAKKGEIEDFAVKIATEKPKVKVIAKWLEDHC